MDWLQKLLVAPRAIPVKKKGERQHVIIIRKDNNEKGKSKESIKKQNTFFPSQKSR